MMFTGSGEKRQITAGVYTVEVEPGTEDGEDVLGVMVSHPVDGGDEGDEAYCGFLAKVPVDDPEGYARDSAYSITAFLATRNLPDEYRPVLGNALRNAIQAGKSWDWIEPLAEALDTANVEYGKALVWLTPVFEDVLGRKAAG